MADKRPALGRGLSALIPDAAAPSLNDRSLDVDTDLLRPNPFQPRTAIDETKIDELARSIRANGIIQPIVVRRAGEGYEIVAGERRWRASQRAGLLKVPVVVRDIPDDRLLAAALIENIQREDLNPVEEAHAYRRLADEYHLTQEQIADAVGKDRSSVANYLRLLKLPQEVLAGLGSGALSMGHARALLGASGRRVTASRLARRDRPESVGARNRSAREKGHAARAAKGRRSRRTSTPAPRKSACASRSARASGSSESATVGRSKSISVRKTNCSDSSRCSRTESRGIADC